MKTDAIGHGSLGAGAAAAVWRVRSRLCSSWSAAAPQVNGKITGTCTLQSSIPAERRLAAIRQQPWDPSAPKLVSLWLGYTYVSK